MITTTSDLVTAVGVLLLMPPIIWFNAYNRHSGLMGYIWRESPWLGWVGVIFLGLVWLTSAIELAVYFGLVSSEAVQMPASVLGGLMLFLSLAVLALSSIAVTKYLTSRRT